MSHQSFEKRVRAIALERAEHELRQTKAIADQAQNERDAAKRMLEDGRVERLMIAKAEQELLAATLAAEQARIDRDTAEMQQRFCAEMIAKDRNPLTRN